MDLQVLKAFQGGMYVYGVCMCSGLVINIYLNPSFIVSKERDRNRDGEREKERERDKISRSSSGDMQYGRKAQISHHVR